MTDQEIIKALRICANGKCDDCAHVVYCVGRICHLRNLLNDTADRFEELTASQHVMTMREDA